MLTLTPTNYHRERALRMRLALTDLEQLISCMPEGYIKQQTLKILSSLEEDLRTLRIERLNLRIVQS